MDKRQFDYMENRIREAAENSEPAFDESAWAKMEERLNNEGNRKHRFLWWWFLLALLFIGMGASYLFLSNKNIKTKIAKTAGQDVAAAKAVQQKNISSSTQPVSNEGEDTKREDNRVGNVISGDVTKRAPNTDNDVAGGVVRGNREKIKSAQNEKVSAKINAGELGVTGEAVGGTDSSGFVLDIATVDKTSADSNAVTLSDTAVKKDSSKISITANLPDSNKTDKAKKETSSNFYFIASVAADIASVKFMSFQNSQVTAKFGIGVGYQFNKKISLQTGFYAGRKKFTAGPDDYHSKSGFYINPMRIVNMEASVLVYDIPLSVRYNVLQKPTTIYYATAGISSFIMKKEEYDCYFTYYNMPRDTSLKFTGNKNFFSVFNISVGIEKKISPNFSLLLEPIISIPLSGVGDGSVKLYSAALQAGIKYIPHRKHK